MCLKLCKSAKIKPPHPQNDSPKWAIYQREGNITCQRTMSFIDAICPVLPGRIGGGRSEHAQFDGFIHRKPVFSLQRAIAIGSGNRSGRETAPMGERTKRKECGNTFSSHPSMLWYMFTGASGVCHRGSKLHGSTQRHLVRDAKLTRVSAVDVTPRENPASDGVPLHYAAQV